MPEITAIELEVASEAWIASIRRTWVKHFPGRECPITNFDSMQPEVRAMFLRAIRDAFRAVTPENVQRRAIRGELHG